VATGRPILLVDIDGVLNVYGVEVAPEGYQDYDIFPEDDEPVRLSLVHGEWLRELSAVFDLVWGSAWGIVAHRHLGPILQLDPFPYVPMPPIPFPPADKVPAIDAYLGDRPAAWIDDLLGPEAIAWAESRTAPTLLVETDPTIGLLREHVDRLTAWAADLA